MCISDSISVCDSLLELLVKELRAKTAVTATANTAYTLIDFIIGYADSCRAQLLIIILVSIINDG